MNPGRIRLYAWRSLERETWEVVGFWHGPGWKLTTGVVAVTLELDRLEDPPGRLASKLLAQGLVQVTPGPGELTTDDTARIPVAPIPAELEADLAAHLAELLPTLPPTRDTVTRHRGPYFLTA